MTCVSFKVTSVFLCITFSQICCFRIRKNKGRVSFGAGRVDMPDGTSHPVHILLTRHGLSCANIVAYFRNDMWSKQHNMMKDPLLCNAGIKFASDMKQEVKENLEKVQKLPPPDAVLSSVLARAIETALLQYDAAPVFVVPYIREHGTMKDNQWNDRATQVASLKQRYPDGWKVNFQYVENLGYDPEGDWQLFLHFLSKTFLPDLIQSLGKQDGEPIVLAVVSHSNFMNAGIVYNACKSHFPNNPSSPKANNNQVVKLSYQFADTANGTQIDVTPPRSLTPLGKGDGESPPCEAIVSGVSLYTTDGTTHPLCKRDIGDQCMQQIRDEGMRSYPELVEDVIKTKADALSRNQHNLENAQRNEKESLKQLVSAGVAELQSLSERECWSGGKPEF